MDFVEAINKAVSSCDVLLAMIGPRWLTAIDKNGRRRVDDANDYVRLEIAAALSRDIRVIPVLVGGVSMPAAEELPDELVGLARRQAYELSDKHKRWDYDVDQLIAVLKEIPGISGASKTPGRPGVAEASGPYSAWVWLSKKRNQATLAFIGGGLVVAIGGAWQAYLHFSDKPKEAPAVTAKEAPAVTASGGGIAAGHDITGSIIQTGPNSKAEQHYYGVSEERFQALSEELGVTKGALTSFFKILEQKQVPLTDLDSTLRDIAKRYKELQDKLTATSSDDEAVRALKRQAKEALDQGEFDKAERLLNEASDTDVAAAKAMQANANNRLLSAAAAKAEAGDVKYTQLAYREAAAYYQKAAQLVPLGEDAVLAGYLNQQGTTLHSAGQYSEAQPPLEHALAIREKALGPKHPDVAQSLNNLAELYRTQGQYAKAEPLFKRSLAIREKALGPEHPNVATSLENYATLLRKLDRTAEAETMEVRAKAIRAAH